jgi:hypothetical protein
LILAVDENRFAACADPVSMTAPTVAQEKTSEIAENLELNFAAEARANVSTAHTYPPVRQYRLAVNPSGRQRSEQNGKGDYRLTRAAEWRAFDSLPLEPRRVLANSNSNWSAHWLRRSSVRVIRPGT